MFGTNIPRSCTGGNPPSRRSSALARILDLEAEIAALVEDRNHLARVLADLAVELAERDEFDGAWRATA